MKILKQVAFTTVLFFLLAIGRSQSNRGTKWTADGNGYYQVENNALVKYTLPDFARSIEADGSKLMPAGTKTSLKILNFYFSADGKRVLIFTNSRRVWRQDTRGDYWVLEPVSGSLTQLGKGRPSSSLMFAKFSPDGKYVAYVSEHNIYVEDLGSHKISPLTKNGTDRMINGTFDWAYEEEFDCRDGFRWSPDSRSIAYWQVDASRIRNFLLINNTDSIYSFTVPVEYPKAGQDPSPCRVGVASINTGVTRWMDVPGDTRQHYIPRMEWAGNNSTLILEQLNRKQNHAIIYLCNATTGSAKAIYQEKNDAWIDAKEKAVGWDWLKGGKDFLWVSEKDGWRHIYRIGLDGKEKLLTKGAYDIISLQSIDEANNRVYFTASPRNATQQYLYDAPLSGGSDTASAKANADPGTHNYRMSPNGRFAIHEFSSSNNASLAEWVAFPAHQTLRILNQHPAQQGPGVPVVEMFQVTTEDNITMDGWMIKPKDFDSTKKYPVLFSVYGEPAATTVSDAAGDAGTPLYHGDIWADGYIQISVEGRGAPAPKGAAWRKAIYRKIGIVNIRDQAMAAKKILQWNFVDSSRIAVHGWSGGGSTTLNLLFQYPEIYKTGIAIAPVANQLCYDNIYQERYMGLPQENMQDFIDGSPISHAKNLRGNLLVIHGTGDDNVHYQGTEMLVNELVKWGKQFQMMSYPNRTHGIREGEGTSAHLSDLFTSYLRTHCPGGGR